MITPLFRSTDHSTLSYRYNLRKLPVHSASKLFVNRTVNVTRAGTSKPVVGAWLGLAGSVGDVQYNNNNNNNNNQRQRLWCCPHDHGH